MKKLDKTKEPQYQRFFEVRRDYGVTKFGLSSNQSWHDDPKHLLFVLARYKFAAKMLSGRNRVLEVGCGDAFYSRLVLQEVGELTVIDFDPLFIKDAESRMDKKWKMKAKVHDILKKPVPGRFDGIYSLDVLEHIPDYHIVLGYLIDHLEIGGLIIEQSPFEEDAAAKEIDIHLKAKVPLEEAMKGMKKIERNIWKKVGDRN